MIAYVDASVLLRVALRQADALPEWRQVERGVASALILTESLRTLDRLRLRASLSDEEVATRRATILQLVASLELVELDEVVPERAAQPMPTELGTLDALHLATAVLWREMSHDDLVMATHDTALGLAARPRLSGRGNSAPNRAVLLCAESTWLWSAVTGDDGTLGLMLVLCLAQCWRFFEPSCQLRVGSGPRGRWFESTRPDHFKSLANP